jgi:outer membrane protein assembly factor BamA
VTAALPRRFSLALVAALALIGERTARAAPPLKTWGGEEAPKEEPTPEPHDVTPPVPPPPPPTPSEPSEPSEYAGGGEPRSNVVRAPGHVGLKYTLEGVEVRGNTTTLSRVILSYVPFRPGDVLDVDDRELELVRYRLLGTGYFRDVELSLRRGTQRGLVILVVSVRERNTIVVNDVWLGLSADADPSGSARPLTAYAGVDAAETNLAGTGIALGGAVAFADQQLGLRARFSDPHYLLRVVGLRAELLYNDARDFFGNRDVLVDDPQARTKTDYAVVSYRRFGGSVGVSRDVGTTTQLFFDYRLERIEAELPLGASHHRGLDVEPIDFFIDPGRSVLSTVRAQLVYDTRDEPILPTRGDQLLLNAETALTPLGSDYAYTKLVVRGATHHRLSFGHVLRFEGTLGAIFGNAPMFEKFYIGDFTDLLPDRVLDLTFDRRAAPDYFGTMIKETRYGDLAARATVEYRIPLYRGTKTTYGIDAFGSTGLYMLAENRDLTDPPRGYSGFQRIPIDLTFNLGLRIDTSVGGFSLGLSNILGFIPVRSSSQ